MLQGFLALGLEKTSAGLGSVIIDSQPITVAVLASLFLGETLSAVGIGGLAIGVLGLLLLVCARAAHTLVRRVPSAPPLSPPRPLDFVRRNRPRAETRREEGGSSRNTHRRRGHRTHTHTHTHARLGGASPDGGSGRLTSQELPPSVAHGLLGEPIDTAAVALVESQGPWYNSGEWCVALPRSSLLTLHPSEAAEALPATSPHALPGTCPFLSAPSPR